ncbi:MAG: hypothetical protein ABI652_03945, partial [Acidobacteriota bacterium]
TNLSPRAGLAWDVFGDGRTALKAAVGRYTSTAGLTGVAGFNPAALTVTQGTRSWTDSNKDFVPQESELGPISPANFGLTNSPTTRQSDNVIHGFNTDPYSWQGEVAFQQQLLSGVAVNVGYFRTQFGNFTATDNLNVEPSNYDFFCLNAPLDAALPGGGGQEICGIHDPKATPAANNLVRRASELGNQSQVYNGVDLTMNARLAQLYLTGGVSIGRTITDNCEILAALPENSVTPVNCHIEPPWSAGTDFKLSATYRTPLALQVSLNYQNSPGIATTATWAAPNSLIAPALGRNLAACRAGLSATQCTSTLTIPIVKNNSLYREDRVNLLNVAVSRNFKLTRMTVRPRFEVGNLLNINTVTSVNTAFSTSGNNGWQQVRGVLTPRTAKLALQMEF